MVTCKKCSLEKEVSEFYKNLEMKSGHLSFCKECVKSRVRERSKLPQVKEYDRNRPNARERSKQNNERDKLRYKSDPNYRAQKMQKQKEARQRKKKEYIARNLINNSVRDGKIFPKVNCERCGISTKTHGHHEDYNRPLDVIWLCTECHGICHKEIKNKLRNHNQGKLP